MYGYLFVHITLHGFFSEFSVVRGGGNDETVSTGCGSPSVLHPWMLLLHMQETALWIPPVCCVFSEQVEFGRQVCLCNQKLNHRFVTVAMHTTHH